MNSSQSGQGSLSGTASRVSASASLSGKSLIPSLPWWSKITVDELQLCKQVILEVNSKMAFLGAEISVLTILRAHDSLLPGHQATRAKSAYSLMERELPTLSWVERIEYAEEKVSQGKNSEKLLSKQSLQAKRTLLPSDSDVRIASTISEVKDNLENSIYLLNHHNYYQNQNIIINSSGLSPEKTSESHQPLSSCISNQRISYSQVNSSISTSSNGHFVHSGGLTQEHNNLHASIYKQLQSFHFESGNSSILGSLAERDGSILLPSASVGLSAIAANINHSYFGSNSKDTNVLDDSSAHSERSILLSRIFQAWRKVTIISRCQRGQIVALWKSALEFWRKTRMQNSFTRWFRACRFIRSFRRDYLLRISFGLLKRHALAGRREANEFRSKYVSFYFFAHWKRQTHLRHNYTKMLLVSTDMNEKLLIIRAFSLWNEKLKCIQIGANLESTCKTFLRKKLFRAWIGGLKLRRSVDLADSHLRQIRITDSFRHWKAICSQSLNNASVLQTFRKERVIAAKKKYVTLWAEINRIYQPLNSKMSLFRNRQKISLRRAYFAKWIHQIKIPNDLNIILETFLRYRKCRLSRTYVYSWLLQHSLNLKQRHFVHRSEHNQQRTFFCSWVGKAKTSFTVRKLSSQKLMLAPFLAWKTWAKHRHDCEALLMIRKRRSLVQIFHDWIHQAQSAMKLRHYMTALDIEMIVIKSWWHRWKLALHNQKSNLSLVKRRILHIRSRLYHMRSLWQSACLVSAQSCQRITFARLKCLLEREKRARTAAMALDYSREQKSTFSCWSRRLRHNQSLNRIASSLHDSELLNKSFHKWESGFYLKRLSKLDSLLRQFQSSKEQRDMTELFGKWRWQTSMITKLKPLRVQLEIKFSVGQCEWALCKWRRNLSCLEVLTSKAVAFSKRHVLRSCLSEWTKAVKLKARIQIAYTKLVNLRMELTMLKIIQRWHYFSHRIKWMREQQACCISLKNAWKMLVIFRHWCKLTKGKILLKKLFRYELLQQSRKVRDCFRAWKLLGWSSQFKSASELKITVLCFKCWIKYFEDCESNRLAMGLYTRRLLFSLFERWLWTFRSRSLPHKDICLRPPVSQLRRPRLLRVQIIHNREAFLRLSDISQILHSTAVSFPLISDLKSLLLDYRPFSPTKRLTDSPAELGSAGLTLRPAQSDLVSFFNAWTLFHSRMMRVHRTADAYRKSKLLSRLFVTWKSGLRLRNYLASFDIRKCNGLILSAFDKWSLLWQDNCQKRAKAVSARTGVISSRYFILWRGRLSALLRQAEKADALFLLERKRIFLSKWNHSYHFQSKDRRLRLVADREVRLRGRKVVVITFDHWLMSYLGIKENIQKGILFSKCSILHKAISFWSTRSRHQEYLERYVDQAKSRILEISFTKWHHLKASKITLAIKLSKYQQSHILFMSFKLWHDCTGRRRKLHRLHQLLEHKCQSLIIHRSNVVIKCHFNAWISRFAERKSMQKHMDSLAHRFEQTISKRNLLKFYKFWRTRVQALIRKSAIQTIQTQFKNSLPEPMDYELKDHFIERPFLSNETYDHLLVEQIDEDQFRPILFDWPVKSLLSVSPASDRMDLAVGWNRILHLKVHLQKWRVRYMDQAFHAQRLLLFAEGWWAGMTKRAVLSRWQTRTRVIQAESIPF